VKPVLLTFDTFGTVVDGRRGQAAGLALLGASRVVGGLVELAGLAGGAS
jgi:hypothetical protein